MNVYPNGKQASSRALTPPLCAPRAPHSWRLEEDEQRKRLTVELSPANCPASLLSCLTRYHANGAVTESAAGAALWGCRFTAARANSHGAAPWVLPQTQKPAQWEILMEHQDISYLDVESGISPMLGKNSGGSLTVYWNRIDESLSK